MSSKVIQIATITPAATQFGLLSNPSTRAGLPTFGHHLDWHQSDHEQQAEALRKQWPMTEQDQRISEAISREQPQLRNFIHKRVADQGDAETSSRRCSIGDVA